MNKSHPFTLNFLTLGLLGLLLLFLGGLEGERDIPMMWLVSGAYTGEVEYYSGFLHPILSGFLATLYSGIPSVPWYVVVWYVIIFISFYQFLALAFQIASNKLIIALFTFCFLIILIGQITVISYTLVAGLAAAVGLVGLIAASQDQKAFSNYQSISSGLLLAAILIDYKTFFLLFWVAFAYLLIFLRKGEIVNFFKANKTIFILMLLLISIQGGFRFSLKYSGFEKFTQARTAVLDHPVFQLSIESNSTAMDKTWVYFAHGLQEKMGTPNLEELETMLAVLKKGYWKQAYFQHYISQLFRGLTDNILALLVGGAVFLMVTLSSPQKRRLLIFTGLWGIIHLVYAYFYGFSGSISGGLFVIILGFGMLNFSNDPRRVDTWFVLCLIVAMSTMLLFQGVQAWQEKSEGKRKLRDLEACLESVPNDQLMLYTEQDRSFFPNSYSYKKRLPLTILDWLSRSPMQQKRYAEYGIKRLEEVDQFYIIQPQGSEIVSNYLNEFFGEYHGKQVGVFEKLEVIKALKIQDSGEK